MNYSPLIGTGAFNSFQFHFFAAPQVGLREGEEFQRFVRFFWCCWLVVHCTWLQQPVHPSRTHLGDVQHFMGWKQPAGSVHCPARSALRFAAFFWQHFCGCTNARVGSAGGTDASRGGGSMSTSKAV